MAVSAVVAHKNVIMVWYRTEFPVSKWHPQTPSLQFSSSSPTPFHLSTVPPALARNCTPTPPATTPTAYSPQSHCSKSCCPPSEWLQSARIAAPEFSNEPVQKTSACSWTCRGCRAFVVCRADCVGRHFVSWRNEFRLGSRGQGAWSLMWRRAPDWSRRWSLRCRPRSLCRSRCILDLRRCRRRLLMPTQMTEKRERSEIIVKFELRVGFNKIGSKENGNHTDNAIKISIANL